MSAIHSPRIPLIAAAIAAWAALGLAPAMAADYRDDIGYVSLTTELGSAIPLGLGIPVSQVEAAAAAGPDQAWLPDLTDGAFAGKSIVDKSAGIPGLYSGHATSVGRLFYGDPGSIAPGVNSIAVYEANHWIGTGYLRLPASGNGYQPLFTSSRVANHSWIGTTTTATTSFDAAILKRLDWVIARDELATVVGLNNGGVNSALLSSSFNAIAVGRTDAGHASGTAAVGLPPYDATYSAGRTRPDVVAPAAVTSTATPMVAAAAALLIGVGNADATLSTDPVAQSTTNRNGNVIRNAERAEVVKAVLMAGALRSTNGNVAAPDITDYRVALANQTANGLDRRFGAGQLNIANSYHILVAGEKNSIQDSVAGGGQAGLRGFDYDPRFGGAAGTNNDVATYYFPVQAEDSRLSFTLAWNLKIHGGSLYNFNYTATLYNLDVLLYDVTVPASPELVASSESTSENTENLHVVLTAGRAYSLQVKRPLSQGTFDWDYGAAWQVTPLLADTDGDGIADDSDNCITTANASQLDADGDGYGNFCDGDFNNNGATNSQDGIMLRNALGTTDPVTDLNGNGMVNAQDTTLFRTLLGYPPGPSAFAP